ncbi:putative F-box domain-containing protein [Rosa chinensis]|uniref:Putative F-box domain-containing protein n=2 Tax=Rosa chinensis TaxID=74649 RepID=A0A2P6RDD3_ROSCH|nr:putative F-box domain-containing protein [Rosa chinensis]
MSCNERNKRRLELPFDSIVEILSWLPVESLLRFKCVCKRWCSLIQDYNFILKNMDRTSTMLLFYPCKSHDENFEFVSSCAGLCMEKSASESASNSTVFRIRNPATHQVLYLPDPPPYTSSVDFAFNSLTGECKVLCFYWEKLYLNVPAAFGFKVITIGKDEQWRPLELPDQNKLRKKRAFRGYYSRVNKVEGVCHLFQIITFTDEDEDMYLEVQSLDLWSEHFTTNTLPQGVSLDWNEVSVLRWNNCLSVGYMKEESLDLMVLQDYKERKWSPNMIIIPVKGPKKNDGRPKFAKEITKIPSTEFDLHINDEGDYRLSSVRKEEMREAKCGETGEILHKPSLVSFKGIMMPENGYYPKNEGK